MAPRSLTYNFCWEKEDLKHWLVSLQLLKQKLLLVMEFGQIFNVYQNYKKDIGASQGPHLFSMVGELNAVAERAKIQKGQAKTFAFYFL